MLELRVRFNDKLLAELVTPPPGELFTKPIVHLASAEGVLALEFETDTIRGTTKGTISRKIYLSPGSHWLEVHFWDRDYAPIVHFDSCPVNPAPGLRFVGRGPISLDEETRRQFRELCWLGFTTPEFRKGIPEGDVPPGPRLDIWIDGERSDERVSLRAHQAVWIVAFHHVHLEPGIHEVRIGDPESHMLLYDGHVLASPLLPPPRFVVDLAGKAITLEHHRDAWQAWELPEAYPQHKWSLEAAGSTQELQAVQAP